MHTAQYNIRREHLRASVKSEARRRWHQDKLRLVHKYITVPNKSYWTKNMVRGE